MPLHFSFLPFPPSYIELFILSLSAPAQARALHPRRSTDTGGVMSTSAPADGKPSHARNTSDESQSHRPSLNTQQPDPNSHIVVKGLPKSVLKKRSADEHTALLASQQREAAASS